MIKILSLLFAVLICIQGFSQILKQQMPEKMVVLTFDDATKSHYTVVAPLLKKYGFGATFFVCEFIPNFSDTTKYMTWEQISELDKMGFEIANHTRTHAHVAGLSKEQFITELTYIENKCDSLDIEKPSAFAYPGYSLSGSALETLKKKGYTYARAGGSRAYDPMTDHPLLIPSWATNSENKKQIMDAFTKARDGKIVVLTIHGVPEIEHPWVNTPPGLFEAYLQYLKNHHYKVISLGQLNNYINTEEAMETIVPDLNRKLKN